MPRSWKNRGREVPADQLRLGTSAEHVLEVLHAGDFERVGIEHRGARRQIAQRAIAQLGRDHDFVERRIRRRPPRTVTNKNGIAHAARNEDVHPYPSAGTSRIRFYGFAAHPRLRPVQERTGHPEARRDSNGI